jgi:hypothetical protein
LVNIVKYGNVRSTDRNAVDAILQELLPRIFIGLPAACINTDDEHTALIFNKLQNINRAINLLNQPQNTEGWLRVLQRLATLQNVHGLLVGISVRILFDKNIFTINQTTTYMRYALSQGNEPKRAAAWLEGFLNGSGILLIHHESLWRILDEWVEELEMERLLELLPILRRTFSEFAPAERQKMLALAQKNDAEGAPQYFEPKEDIFYDKTRGDKVLASIQPFL